MRIPSPWLLLAALSLAPASAPAQQVDLQAPVRPLVLSNDAEAPVQLESAAIAVEPGAGVARTTVELVFRNPNHRVLEGNLQFPLRPGQQVAGFALDVGGTMREAVPVAKERGRQVFEAIERRGIDPGLLEQTGGDFFRLRIYPFPPGGTRRVRIDLVEPLVRTTGGAGVTLPLGVAQGPGSVEVVAYGPQAPSVTGLMRSRAFETERAGVHRMRLARGDWPRGRDVTLRFPVAPGPSVNHQHFGDGHYFVAEVPVDAAPAARRAPSRIGLLWDSSMSGATRFHDLELALLDAYFRALGDVEVDLVRLRDVPEAAGTFRVAGGDWSRLRTALEATAYDGASNPGGWTPDRRVDAYLLFSDGLFNHGDDGFPGFAGAQRLVAVHAAPAGDTARLQALAEARHGEVVFLRERADLAGAVAQLRTANARLQSLEGVGVADLEAESRVVRDGVLRIAGRMTEPTASLRLAVVEGDRVVPVTVDLRAGGAAAREGGLAAFQWARFRLARLQAAPEANRAAITGLGTRFRIVTPGTSLIVLEDVADYVRYDIAPPAELTDAFARQRAKGHALARESRQARLDRVADAWAERVAWWERPFPKTPRPPEVAEGADLEAPEPVVTAGADAPAEHEAGRQTAEAQAVTTARMAAPPPAPVPAPQPPASTTLDRVQITGTPIDGLVIEPAERTTIRLTPWQSDAPFARRLRQASPDAVYALYLDERGRAEHGTAFYLDVADILFAKDRHALALRVLSNLAEMDLENRHVLRVLAYRLAQAGRTDLALPVLERVLAMGGEEPQSYRDLGLALAAEGEWQRAADMLYEVVQGEWDMRFRDIEQTALAELNALLATAPSPIDIGAYDPRLLRNLPLELRVVLAWDSDNSDMDLWVTDPNGEKAYYGNELTYQGGRMSDDFTGGYGPEEFALRDAIPGTYRVEANLYGDRQQIVTGATTLKATLTTGFGTSRQREQVMTLRLTDAKETVLVGEFEVE